jgi:hypothetical protein
MNRTMVVATSQLKAYKPPLQPQREHFLRAVKSPLLGLRVDLTEQPVVIGRSDKCGLVIADPMVSSRHCEVSIRRGQADAFVTDLQSTNGTFIEGRRIKGTAHWPNGAMLHVGSHVFKHEYVSRSEADKAVELDRDIEKAAAYVRTLLPAPIRQGQILTDWVLQPCTGLGGDAFGYHELGHGVFAGYLIDVSGHGVGAAMHSVSVINVLRQKAIPGVDFSDPAQVLRGLNDMFQMESHAGMYFTMWYGVYDLGSRILKYSSGGHHASYLTPLSGGSPIALKTRNPVIGAMPGISFKAESIAVESRCRLHIFSDGVFEVITKQETQWELKDFLALIGQPSGVDDLESQRLFDAVMHIARPGGLDDDFSMLTVTFL